MERNRKAALLATLSALLLAVVGYSGARGVHRFFSMLESWLGPRPGRDAPAHGLAAIGSLGGIAVFVGGVLIYKDHVRGGRLLILLGSGAGFVSLVLFLIGIVRRGEQFSLLLEVLPAVVGVALGIAARFVARPTPIA